MIRKYIPEPIKEVYRWMRASVSSVDLNKSMEFAQSQQELEASKNFSVIVPIHDAPEVASRCLNSLSCYGGDAEIILVNDGSKLEETTKLINHFQQKDVWQVLDHSKAHGHSLSCEAGGKLASRKYLCFLNSDTVITPWSWAAIRVVFESDSNIAVVGPSTSWAWTGQSVPRAMHCRWHWNDSQIWNFAQKYVAKQPPKSWVDLPEISGFAFFIRRSVWEQFGGFDTNLPNYGNETELCRRLRRQGLRMVWAKNSYIHHFGQASFGGVMTRDQIRSKRVLAKEFIDSLQSEDTDN